ncbi:receptor-like protein EIX1 [Cornus florida]|uniref:receptor-like protein EIX1 n=1 Tax=Cornus florida TaxID=4283 RepID=UPI002899677C|nr:receptor-like protein EIX1 [Cornus florida]
MLRMSSMHSTISFSFRCSNLIIFLILVCLLGFPYVQFAKLGLATEVSSITCIDTERKALLAFKQSLTDPSGRLSSWTGQDCCQWSGIGCNDVSGHVVKLDLRNLFPSSSEGIASTAQGNMTAYERSFLGGEINPSLLELKYLNYLDLSQNGFEGIPIPKFFGAIKNLRYLNLSFASFAGEIPPHIGNLSSLNYLDLYADSLINLGMWELSSASLQWLSGLSSLTYLNMGQVKLSDVGTDWLQAVNMLPNLIELHLHSCDLQRLPFSLPFVNFTRLSILDISGNSINSSIPTWLFNLTSLTKLDFNGNSFSGAMPSEFVNLMSLEYLDLSSNGNIGGRIPSFLGNLCKLKNLDLSGNNFSGEIVESFGGFSGCPNSILVSLDLSANQLEGELPDSLGTLENLQRLDLSSNSFWGSIPATIGSLSALQEMDLSFNSMNGTIPESFGQLSKLVHLYLMSNPWEGVITEVQLMNLTRLEHVIVRTSTIKSLILNVTYEWIPPFRLKSLELENCLVGPTFPMWLQVQSELTSVTLKNVGIEDIIPQEWFSTISSQLTYLDLSNNGIKGTLPHQLESPNINAIDLSYNRFEGPLPLWSTNAPHFYLQSNLFSGPIPTNIDELMPQLEYLYFSENRLNGTIPSSICTMKGLQVLSLRSNQLSGELPQCWNESQPLWVVDVANNNLSGNIPSSMGFLGSLNILMLSNNSLEGEIPPSLQNCSLASIDLGDNRLSGNLPLWIGENATFFWRIRLRSNSFSGNIPRKWCNLPFVHMLDLGHNNLSSVIPNCLDNLTSLFYGNSSKNQKDFFRIRQYYYEEQATVVAKGRELEYGRTLEYVNIIDLSGNSLVGEIPEGITRLTALGTLNLSMNHLDGYIPKNIGNLRWLETLDVSNNNLSGTIPQSLSSLTFLSHLNLSHNNLTGRIPSGNQLQTLDDLSIYEGNPLLCGLPLPTKCPGDDDKSTVPAPHGSSEGIHSKNDSEMLWFYVSMGLGFVVGLCGVCCTLLIKESWRTAYFRFVRIL